MDLLAGAVELTEPWKHGERSPPWSEIDPLRSTSIHFDPRTSKQSHGRWECNHQWSFNALNNYTGGCQNKYATYTPGWYVRIIFQGGDHLKKVILLTGCWFLGAVQLIDWLMFLGDHFLTRAYRAIAIYKPLSHCLRMFHDSADSATVWKTVRNSPKIWWCLSTGWFPLVLHDIYIYIYIYILLF